MRVSAKVDYAIRAIIELAVVAPEQIKGEKLAAAQAIPQKFLESILVDLRNAGLVASQRGAEGGYWLAKPADTIKLADVIRAVEGPLADVRGQRPETLEFTGAATDLRKVWLALRVSLRSVLEQVTVADVASGQLPPLIDDLLADPEAYVPH